MFIRENAASVNIVLTLRSQRPVQSCVFGLLVTDSRNRTRWGRRSAPGRRTPSRHSSWRRSSGCRCSVEKQRMKKQNKDKSSLFGFFIRSVVHLSAGKHNPDVTLRHRPTIDTSSSFLCIHSSRSTEWNCHVNAACQLRWIVNPTSFSWADSCPGAAQTAECRRGYRAAIIRCNQHLPHRA